MRLRKQFPKHPKCKIDRDRVYWKEKVKIDCLLKTLEKLLNSQCCGEEEHYELNVTSGSVIKKGHVRGSAATLPFNKALKKDKVSALLRRKKWTLLEGSICGIPCLMLVDTGAMSPLRTDLAQNVQILFTRL
ncbi:hypothetical protein AVEN_81107-1 [Araneus ventricosus]|uniref:Uncharacterized protein n=1 Tax=Araneus ventricosus TaxID=182803 RepID=A0A4Y2DTQ9_ARAVE|nr:hypothetical protein AVEN_81107-1 [Araneus ventricosus]